MVYSYLFILLFIVPWKTLAQESWNYENVGENLKNWLNTLDSVQDVNYDR